MPGEGGSPRIRTEILHQKGRALFLSGRAKRLLRAWRKLWRDGGASRDRAGEAETLYELARAERRLGNTDEALFTPKRR